MEGQSGYFCPAPGRSDQAYKIRETPTLENGFFLIVIVSANSSLI